jgi:hypothetical protein
VVSLARSASASGPAQLAQIAVPFQDAQPDASPLRGRTPASRRHFTRIAGLSDYRT